MFIRRYHWPLRAPRAGLRLFGLSGMARLTYELARLRTGRTCVTLPYEAAGLLAVAGDREAMFECLLSAPIESLTFINAEPEFEPYRRDPRFVALLERTGRRPRVAVSAAPPPTSGEGG